MSFFSCVSLIYVGARRARRKEGREGGREAEREDIKGKGIEAGPPAKVLGGQGRKEERKEKGRKKDGKMTGDMDFGQLMQQAAAIKTEQVKADRRKYESSPQWLQHSLFQCIDTQVAAARAEPCVEERVEIAQRFKEAGNDLFRRGDWVQANDKYERCVGCFWYISTTNKDWKKRGIRDEDIDFVRDDDIDSCKQVRELIVSCLNNIAQCHINLEEFSDCIRVCDTVLELDPNNVKALYRKAEALVAPLSSGATHLEQAVRYLKQAATADPTNKALRRRYQQLVDELKTLRAADKKTFSNVFQRSETLEAAKGGRKSSNNDDGEEGVSSAAAREKAGMEDDAAERKAHEEKKKGEIKQEKQVRDQLDKYRDMSHQLKSKGRVKDAEQIDEIIHSTEKQLDQQRRVREMDFFNPTPEMIQEAKELHGLDLNDKNVQKMLHHMMQNKIDPNASNNVVSAKEEEAAGEGSVANNASPALLIGLLMAFLSLLTSWYHGGSA